ncbi:MAG: D-aminoacylase [Acidobacteriota bacterium]
MKKIYKVIGFYVLFFGLNLLLLSYEFDIIIKNGRIIDGTGNPWFYGDVGVKDGKIVFVGKTGNGNAKKVIESRSLVVAPGFIDVLDQSDFTILVDGNAESKIRQGVTTLIYGEGGSAAPLTDFIKNEWKREAEHYGITLDWTTLKEYYEKLMKGGISVNIATYVGAAQVRMAVIGAENREPTHDELERMKQLVAQAMEDGAVGISSALIYPPGSFAKTDELIELCKVVSKYGGIYATHIRNEGDRQVEALKEAIEIGMKANLPVEIFHFKVAGKENWGNSKIAISLIEEARSKGLDITADQYPYIASSTSINATVPPWVHEGGTEKYLSRLQDKELRKKIKDEMLHKKEGWENMYLGPGGWENILIASLKQEKNKIYEGKSVSEAAKIAKKDPFEFVFDLIVEEKGSVGAIYFSMAENDVKAIMKTPWVMIDSDWSALRPDGILGEGKPHPRAYGTFPRVLGKYVREEKILTLEDAIRKMTSFPAQRFKFKDRGLIWEGMSADITVFNPETVIDKATFQNPHQYPEGIEYVIVNGILVIDKGNHTGARSGKILYGPGKK